MASRSTCSQQASSQQAPSLAFSQPKELYEIVVVGAGAAGLAAAAEAGLAGASVVLLEKADKAGLKILISGGGHCNLTTSLPMARLEREYGREGGRFLRHALRQTSPTRVRQWMEEAGVPTTESQFDKVWPVSMQAKDVLRVLQGRCRLACVELRASCPVRGIQELPMEGGGWELQLASGRLKAKKLILATGGKSYPRTGTTGDGYSWLEELGYRLFPTLPALVPLRCTEAWVRELSGITLPDVEVQLREKSGKIVMRRQRPVLFTHKGISGPGPMDLSRYFEREADRFDKLFVDLVPELRSEELERGLFHGTRELFTRLREHGIPKRLVHAILTRQDLQDIRPTEIPKAKRRALLSCLKGLPLPVSGTLGFAHAELTTGGLALADVDPRSMELKGHAGLYVTGELLDVDGPIGGFSFQLAFSTGALAGLSAARAVKQKK